MATDMKALRLTHKFFRSEGAHNPEREEAERQKMARAESETRMALALDEARAEARQKEEDCQEALDSLGEVQDSLLIMYRILFPEVLYEQPQPEYYDSKTYDSELKHQLFMASRNMKWARKMISGVLG